MRADTFFTHHKAIITKVRISLFFNSLQDFLVVGLYYIIIILNICVSVIDHGIENCCKKHTVRASLPIII